MTTARTDELPFDSSSTHHQARSEGAMTIEARELVESISSSTGVMIQTYRPNGRATFGNAGE
jgi:hypothetical protein